MSRLKGLGLSARLVLAGFFTVILAVVAVAGARAAATSGHEGSYRLATAEVGSVTETVTTSGTVDATQRRDIAVAVSGSVSDLAVATGDTVAAGQVLVTLDRERAERAVRKAEATLAQAEADLESAQNAQETVVQTANNDRDNLNSDRSGPSTGGTSGLPPEQPDRSQSDGPPTGQPTVQPTAQPTDAPVDQPTEAPDPEPSEGGGSGPIESLPSISFPSIDELRALQSAVTTAQSAASSSIAEASAALDTQISACSDAYGREPSGASESDEASSTNPANDACDAALAAVQSAQQTVSDRQSALQSAIDKLAEALVTAVNQTDNGVAVLQGWIDRNNAGPSAAGANGKATTSTTQGVSAHTSAHSATTRGTSVQTASLTTTGISSAATSSAVTSNESTVSTVSSNPSGSASGVAAASALSVAHAQASIDTAAADLLAAEQDLAATDVVTTSPGTVTAVNVAAGDTVSAGDVLVTVVGDGGASVTLNLSSTDIRKLTVGASAEVILPGAADSVSGDVAWVSPIASTTSGSFPFATSSTYLAEVHVPAASLGDVILPQGARAEVAITTGNSDDVVTVPTSAVIPQAGSTMVRVLGTEGIESRTVEVGLVGASRAEITSGIKEGEQVVLAELDADIDAAGEISTNIGGGFPPGGAFPGGGGRNGLPGGGVGFPGGTRP